MFHNSVGEYVLDIIKKFKAILWLSWKELSISFFCQKCPNSWDFPRLILSFSIILGLFAVGTKHGLLENFSAVLLGEIPGKGIPMWLNPNIGSGNLKEKSFKVLSAKKLNFYPFLDVQSAHLRLPRCRKEQNTDIKETTACKLWKIVNKSSVPVFKGISVFQNDPLWLFSTPSLSSQELQVVLNRNLFVKYFQYDSYYKLMKSILPRTFAKNLPLKKAFFDPEYTGKIWLSFGSGNKRRVLIPFNVKWVDYIPISDEIAFLLPLETYHGIYYEKNKKLMRGKYFSTESIKQPPRVESTFIYKPELGEYKNKIIKQYQNCLQRINPVTCQLQVNTPICEERYTVDDEFKDEGDSVKIMLHPLKPYYWAEACIKEIGMVPCDNKIDENCINLNITKKSPVKFIFKPSDSIFQLTLINLETKKEEKITDISYDKGFIYPKDPTALLKAREEIENLEGEPFYFNKRYEDSLTRFNALSEILKELSRTYGVWIISFVVLLLGVQLAVIVSHRKSEFKVYMWKGIEKQYIFFLVSIQVLVSSLAAFLLSYFLIKATIWIIDYKMLSISHDYTSIFFGNNINVFSVFLVDFITVYLSIITICFIWLFVFIKWLVDDS